MWWAAARENGCSVMNEDLPGGLLQEPRGAQRSPNGNSVVTSFATGKKNPNVPKVIEVTPEKNIVWTFTDRQLAGIHQLHIPDTNGRPVRGRAMW